MTPVPGDLTPLDGSTGTGMHRMHINTYIHSGTLTVSPKTPLTISSLFSTFLHEQEILIRTFFVYFVVSVTFSLLILFLLSQMFLLLDV